MKRQRGRGRKPGQSNNPNRAYESNGPDIKVRGSAQTVFEKYQQLARDCMSQGDRILAENYLQHAEHYLRLIKSMQPGFQPRPDLMVSGYAGEDEDGEFDGEEGEFEGDGSDGGEGPPVQQQRPPRDDQGQRRERYQQNGFQQNGQGGDQRRERRDEEGDGEGRFGRRRRRRDRFGRDGAEGAPEGEGGTAQEPRVAALGGESLSEPQELVPASAPDGEGRAPRPPRRERRPRREDEATGFGGELPSFLAPAPAAPAAD